MAKRVGFSTKCKVCNSEHRHEIEQWLVYDGLTLVECEKKVKGELGENISRTAIWRHMREHFMDKTDIRDAYKEKKYGTPKPKPEPAPKVEPKDRIDLAYEKSQLLKERYVNESLSEVEKLDDMIDHDYAMYRRAVELMAEKMEQKLTPKPLVDFLKTLNANITTNMRTKAELLGTDAAGRQASVMETWIDLVESLDD